MNDLNQNTSQNYTGGNPYESVAPVSATSEPAGSVQFGQVGGGQVYAGFFQRFLAALIDGVLVGVGSAIISAMFGVLGDSAKSLGSLLGMIAGYAYFVYFTSQKGQTLGKQAMGIRVQNMETGQNLDVVSAILREVVGKFISSLVLLLGYFWMLWDPNKQTWHDKIAKSVVVKVK